VARSAGGGQAPLRDAAARARRRAFSAVLEDFDVNIKPYAVGNTHPLFFGWVHGAGTRRHDRRNARRRLNA